LRLNKAYSSATQPEQRVFIPKKHRSIKISDLYEITLIAESQLGENQYSFDRSSNGLRTNIRGYRWNHIEGCDETVTVWQKSF
jgi:hypothetical protein